MRLCPVIFTVYAVSEIIILIDCIVGIIKAINNGERVYSEAVYDYLIASILFVPFAALIIVMARLPEVVNHLKKHYGSK